MTHKILHTRFAVVLLAVLAAGAGCSTPTGPSQDRLEIKGSLNLTAVGQQAQLTATFYPRDGAEQNVTNDTAWTSDAPSVATISQTGLLTAVGIGSAKIAARYDRSNAAMLSVTTLVQVAVDPKAIRLTGTLSLPAAGATSRLTLTAVMNDGSTADVTSAATWSSSDHSVATIQPGGLLTAVGLGVASIAASYRGRTASDDAVVTPPGTLATRGRVRLPGAGQSEGLGVAGFQVMDTQTGQTTTSNAQGSYTMGGLTVGTRLAFTKTDYEPAEIIAQGFNGDVTVQNVVRLTAGESAQSKTAPNDVSYVVTPNGPCLNCRLIRVVVPTSGTLHVSLSWDVDVTENLWIQGQMVSGPYPGTIAADVPVEPGELVLYAGMAKPPLAKYVTLKLSTSMSVPQIADPGGR